MIEFKKLAASTTPLLVELTRYLMSGVYRDLEKQALQIAARLYFLHVFALVSAIFSILSVITIIFMTVARVIGALSFTSLNLLFFGTACVVLLFSIITYARVTHFVKEQTPKENTTNLDQLFEQVVIVLKKLQDENNGDSQPVTQAMEKRLESMENSILLLIQAMETKSQPSTPLHYARLKDL